MCWKTLIDRFKLSRLKSVARFCPRQEKVGIVGLRRNVGLYSTAISIHTMMAYKNEINKLKRAKKIETLSFNTDQCKVFFKFIIRGLTTRLKKGGEVVTQPALLSKINTLVWFRSFFEEHFRDSSVDKDNDIAYERSQLNSLLIDIIIDYYNEVFKEIENAHPYITFKFLQFLSLWNEELAETIDVDENWNKLSDAVTLEIEGSEKEKREKLISYKFWFEKVYTSMKYELYRQMALKLSGDMTLFDVKRLIYSLLTVYVNDKFSNSLVRDKALSIIFEAPAKEPNSIWSAGQQVHLSIDSLESITSLECLYDLIGGKNKRESNSDFLAAVTRFMPEIRKLFFSILRTAQKDEKNEIIGWYPLNQRDKTSTSWTSAFTLLFIKRFCKFLSFEIARKAKCYFNNYYQGQTTVDWNDIYDHTAVKSKLRLMFPPEDVKQKAPIEKKKSKAMFFGPPGTGKTTLARSVAKKLGWQYLELTPGDFYAGGEEEILHRINEIFYNLKYLKETVVFIDEIDDLVVKRREEHFDPRSLYINTLLPRFQDLHDNEDIILIASTNNINNIDTAIYRLGRFDLVLPVFSISMHGRIDFLTKKLFGDSKDPIPGTEHESVFYDNVLEYIKGTQDYTYSQLEIFVTELYDKLKCKTKLLKENQAIIIEDISSRLKFTNMWLTYNTEQAIVYENRKSRKEEYRVVPRPFSENDATDIGDMKEAALKDDLIRRNMIPLYYETYNCLHFNQNNENNIDNKLWKLLDREKPLYSIVTPFFDDIEKIYEKLLPAASNPLQKSYNKLKEIIYKRK